MKLESCSHLALQDFTTKHGTLHSIKIYDDRTENGTKWTEEYRLLHMKQHFTELYSPHQNYAEHGAHVLSVVVRRPIRECNVTHSQHHWAQR